MTYKYRPFTIHYSLLTISCLLISGCSIPAWEFGTGGYYNAARREIMRPRGGDLDRAIRNLVSIVKEDPTYKDSLTLLGRAYYKKGQHQIAAQFLERALLVNREDEIAWLVLGISQLRLGADEKGLENVKRGLTLSAKAMSDGYRKFEDWDVNGLVRSSLRRSVLVTMKGLEEKRNIIRNVETLLRRIDDEEFFQGRDRAVLRDDGAIGD